MQIDNLWVRMGHSSLLNKTRLHKYPKKCIQLGQIFKTLGQRDNVLHKQIIFYGNVLSSRNEVFWEFEIMVDFDVAVDVVSTFNSDQEEVDAFMVLAYSAVEKEFDNYVGRDILLMNYQVCPLEFHGIELEMFTT